MLVDFGEKKEEAWRRGWGKKNYNSSGADADDDDDDGNYYDYEKDKFTLGIQVLEF